MCRSPRPAGRWPVSTRKPWGSQIQSLPWCLQISQRNRDDDSRGPRGQQGVPRRPTRMGRNPLTDDHRPPQRLGEALDSSSGDRRWTGTRRGRGQEWGRRSRQWSSSWCEVLWGSWCGEPARSPERPRCGPSRGGSSSMREVGTAASYGELPADDKPANQALQQTAGHGVFLVPRTQRFNDCNKRVPAHETEAVSDSGALVTLGSVTYAVFRAHRLWMWQGHDPFLAQAGGSVGRQANVFLFNRPAAYPRPVFYPTTNLNIGPATAALPLRRLRRSAPVRVRFWARGVHPAWRSSATVGRPSPSIHSRLRVTRCTYRLR